MKLVKKIVLLVIALGIGLSSFVVVNFQRPFQKESLQIDNFKDWSDDGLDFKIAKEKYLENTKKLPKHISEQIEEDKKNNKKSFSQDALPLKYLDDQQRETFFWIKDEQIQNTKNEIVKWWENKNGTKIVTTPQQINKVKKAFSYIKQRLIKQGWYQNKKSKSSWEFYQKYLGSFLTLKKVNDGDTMQFDGLDALKLLEPTKNQQYGQKDNARTLVVDTDETFWTRYQKKQQMSIYQQDWVMYKKQ